MTEVEGTAPRFGAYKPEIAPNEPCPCGSGDSYDRCHGADGPSTVRIVFYVDPEIDHRALVAVPDDAPMVLGQLDDDLAETHFYPWEDVYGLGPAEDLVSQAGHERLGALVHVQSISPDNYLSLEVQPGDLLIGIPFDVIRGFTIDLCRSTAGSTS